MEYLSLTYKKYRYSEYKIVLKTKETENYLGEKHNIYIKTTYYILSYII